MTDDLVQRLRDIHETWFDHQFLSKTSAEAADRIEALERRVDELGAGWFTRKPEYWLGLEAALREIVDLSPAYRGELSIKIARRALEDK